jgi:hypothetical protein
MRTFAQRLETVKNHGLMTTADLARWFDRPYPTVTKWLRGHEPWGPNGERARLLLDLLEEKIKARDGFPVPVQLTPVERRDYLQGVRRGIERRLPSAYSA